MNNLQPNEIPEKEVQFFKERVQRWLHIDEQITTKEKEIRELKKVRNKELEPEITKFMNEYNVKDLNTDNGKIRCQERKTKKGLNKHNIRENLSKFLTEQEQLDDAMNTILKEREIVISYKLKKLK
jgi:hypothetical protein|tara:strand:- start:4 stop:381 length:378 start_codon:yes stop_codon:yes gene_type:complete